MKERPRKSGLPHILGVYFIMVILLMLASAMSRRKSGERPAGYWSIGERWMPPIIVLAAGAFAAGTILTG